MRFKLDNKKRAQLEQGAIDEDSSSDIQPTMKEQAILVQQEIGRLVVEYKRSKMLE
jgi:hypothetical protein